ncbi:MAG: class I tRNA ligase family protein, partial [Acidobacteriota bacterium]|nr:class I tRNA ligase family protein [Acidobacteriota bacterium]
TAFDPGVFKVGKRLAMKVFNASRFVLMQLDREDAAEPVTGDITEPLDLALVARLRDVITTASRAFEAFDYTAALKVIEESFWQFCDHYLELVKLRSYSEDDTPARRSALATLGLGLNTYLRLLAPFLPFVTDEAWSWKFAGAGRLQSVHTAPWPTEAEFEAIAKPVAEGGFEAAVDVMTAIRGAKTVAQKSLRWPVAGLEITGSEAARAALAPMMDDILRAGNVVEGGLTVSSGAAPEGATFEISVTLADTND